MRLPFRGILSGEIRTHDPLHPMQVRYQAALRPEYRHYIGICAVKQSTTLYNVGYECGFRMVF